MRPETIREIEFRGREKRHDGTYGPWIYGGYSHADMWPEIIDYGGIEQGVEPETVGQWTGLLDKGFHRVYEGDVVDTMWDVSKDYHHIGVVKYSHECALFGVVDSRGEGLSFEHLRSGLCTIIGDVFDSPELREIYGKYYFKDNVNK